MEITAKHFFCTKIFIFSKLTLTKIVIMRASCITKTLYYQLCLSNKLHESSRLIKLNKSSCHLLQVFLTIETVDRVKK